MAYSVAALGRYNPQMNRTGITNNAVGLLGCLLLCVAFSLTACGQRGPLYLPEAGEESVGAENGDAEEEQAGENAEESNETTPRT